MSELLYTSVHLMVTSPPYNLDKEYDDELTLEEYLAFLGMSGRRLIRCLFLVGQRASMLQMWVVNHTLYYMLY